MSLGDSPSGGCELTRLVGLVGPAVLQVLVEPPEATAVVSGTAIEDPGDPLPELPGGLLLLIGGSGTAGVDRSMRRAAAAGFVGVVLKPRGDDLGPTLEVARELGLAVLSAGDAIRWRELAALVDAALWPYVAETEPQTSSGPDELFAIADAVAGAVGGAVVIEDLDCQILAYSNIPGQRIDPLRSQGILARRVPDLPENDEFYRRVRAADAIVRFPKQDDELARAAVAIRAGAMPLGTMWAIEGDGGLSTEGRRAIEEGAQLASLHMLRARSAIEVDQHLRGELLRSLLEGDARSQATVHRLGLPYGEPQALLALGPGRSLSRSGLPLIALAARDVGRHCRALRPDAVVTTLNRAVYILIGGRDVMDGAVRLARMLLQLLDHSIGSGMCVGIDTDHGPMPDLTAMRARAEDVLRVVSSGDPTRRIATLDDVRRELLLLRAGQALQREPHLRHPVLDGTPGGHTDRRLEMTETLQAWFSARFDIRRAAEGLHVHPNTLRYRLRRYAETSGLDLDDPDECLCLWLQLRADALFATPAP